MTIGIYSFRVQLREPVVDEDQDRLYDAIDDEISVETGPKGNWVGFDRQAPTFLDAVLSAVLEISNLGFEPLAIEDELVSLADIAERTGRTRQSVSMIASARRGRGGFPPPAVGNVRSPLWHWADVAAWFDEDTTTDNQDRSLEEDRSLIIATMNGALANRRMAARRPADLDRIKTAMERLAG
ncbi:MAG: hypothetical protein M3063_03350 [Actinomycetota bacterium]|nr:hypothetical protein [Actinomycetota bacterium]MDQ6947695.1 hypothetical protein [Actinomycetota bacterium]